MSINGALRGRGRESWKQYLLLHLVLVVLGALDYSRVILSGYYKLLDLLRRRRRRRSLGTSPSATTVAQRTSTRRATTIAQEHFAT